MVGQRLHLGATVELELAPRIGHLRGPFRRAVIVDDLLLRRRHRVVALEIHVVGEHRGVERHVHRVLDGLLDAEQEHRSPRERDFIGDAALDGVARFRRRSLHIGAAEHLDHFTDGRLRRADLQALEIFRHQNLLLAEQRAGIVDEGEAQLGVLHLGRCILVIPLVERQRALLAVAEHKRKLPRRGDREASRLITRIDVSDVGDTVARHVVVVERLAELLRGEHRQLDAAARGLLDILGPGDGRRHQRMRRRHPQRNFQIDGLVLRRGSCDSSREGRRRARGDQHRHNGFVHERPPCGYAQVCLPDVIA